MTSWSKEVDLQVKGRKIVIAPVKITPRSGWEEAFNEMHKNNDDHLLINDGTDLEMENWEW